MRKKFYLPDNIVIVIFCLFLLILGLPILAQAICVLVLTFYKILDTDFLVTLLKFGIFALLMFVDFLIFYKISQYLCYTIILDKEKVYIHQDTNFKKRRIQYYTAIKYNDISSIEILWSNKKSNGEVSGECSITGGSATIPYLCINSKNGDQKLFMIMFTSKKRIKKLIIELQHRIELSGNDIPLLNIDLITESLY